MPGNSFIVQLFLRIHSKTKLVEEILKAIVFEQLLIIRWIIIEAINGRLETLYQQAPPPIPFAKIDWAVHGMHTSLKQPMFCNIEKHVRGCLVIDTIKKTNSSNETLITLCFVFFVYKSSNSPD